MKLSFCSLIVAPSLMVGKTIYVGYSNVSPHPFILCCLLPKTVYSEKQYKLLTSFNRTVYYNALVNWIKQSSVKYNFNRYLHLVRLPVVLGMIHFRSYLMPALI